MKDYQRLKPILESKDFFREMAEGSGNGEVPGASRSSPPSKPSVKRRLDLLPASDDGGETHGRTQRRSKNTKNPTPRYVCSPIPPPMRHAGGIVIQEGIVTPAAVPVLRPCI